MKILCVGISTRPMVESAVKAGFDVFAVDYFGDLDTKAACGVISLQERGYRFPPNPKDYWSVAWELGFDAFVYTAPLENYPNLVENFSKKARLLGTTPSSLKRVRNFRTFCDFCREEGILFPKTFFEIPQPARKMELLLKPKKGGGGVNIRPYHGVLPKGYFLQQLVSGTPCSVTFVADGHDARIISTTQQLIGEKWLGACGFSWCGNIVPLFLKKSQEERLERICKRLAKRFGLVGCMGMDFLLADDVYVLEVNPRLCGSMDAVEKAYDINLFDLHVKACEGEIEEDFSKKRFCAKAILYAKKDLVVKGTERFVGTAMKDIPRPGTEIRKGEPLSSVLAEGKTRRECIRNLKEEVGKAKRFFYGAYATHSISTENPRGSEATPTVARAGKSSLK